MSIEQKIREILTESNTAGQEVEELDEDTVEELDEDTVEELDEGGTDDSWLDDSIEESVNLYQYLLDNAETISEEDILSAVSSVVDQLPEELAKEWLNAAGVELNEDGYSSLCEDIDLYNEDQDVIEEGLFSFGQAIGRGISRAAKATDSAAASLRDRLKARGQETKSKFHGAVGSVVRSAQTKLASATGSKGPSKTQNRFEKKASQAGREGAKLRKSSSANALDARKHALGGVKKLVDRVTSSYEYPDLPAISEDVAALVDGENLTEEFKEKAATIFESAVMNRVKQEVAKLDEMYESRLDEEVKSITEGLVEKVDGYLDYVVEQWIEQNEIALERGIKSEILENFVGGLKSLFEEHYIELPEEKFDILGSMEEKIEDLTTRLDEQMESNVELNKEIATYQVAQVIADLSEGLVATDKEKFHALVEELVFDGVDSFTKKAQTIRESYFTNKTTVKSVVNSVVTDSPVTLSEGNEYIAPQMRNYLSVLDNIK